MLTLITHEIAQSLFHRKTLCTFFWYLRNLGFSRWPISRIHHPDQSQLFCFRGYLTTCCDNQCQMEIFQQKLLLGNEIFKFRIAWQLCKLQYMPLINSNAYLHKKWSWAAVASAGQFPNFLRDSWKSCSLFKFQLYSILVIQRHVWPFNSILYYNLLSTYWELFLIHLFSNKSLCWNLWFRAVQ